MYRRVTWLFSQSRSVADRKTLWLIKVILNSGAGIQADERLLLYFPGDNLFAALRPTGLPIGNLTSQFLANAYLDSLDQFVKHELRVKGNNKQPGGF